MGFGVWGPPSKGGYPRDAHADVRFTRQWT